MRSLDYVLWLLYSITTQNLYLKNLPNQNFCHIIPKVIDFPRYNTKFSGENEILRGIFRLVSRFPLHFVLYCRNLDYFLDSEIVFVRSRITIRWRWPVPSSVPASPCSPPSTPGRPTRAASGSASSASAGWVRWASGWPRQGWEFALLLIRSWLLRSFALRSFAQNSSF